MFLSKTRFFLFKRLTLFHNFLNATVVAKSNIKSYPLNYFLEHEAKVFENDEKINKALKVAILLKNIERLQFNFNEQNFVMSLYGISYYLQNYSEKQNASKMMNSILSKNYQKIQKFSSYFTILSKSMDGTFKFDIKTMEKTVHQALVTLKTQYTFRDYGTILASFFSMINNKNWMIKNENQKKELDVFVNENYQKVGFDASLQIATSIAENNSMDQNSGVFLKILQNLEDFMLFFDFLKFLKFLRVLMNIFGEKQKISKEVREQILEKSDTIIRGLNVIILEKMKQNSQIMANQTKYNNVTIKEYYQDVSVLLKIYVDLKNLGNYLRETPKNKEENYRPEKEFAKLFLDQSFVLGEFGKKQQYTVTSFYDRFLKKNDQDGDLKKFLDSLF